MFVDLHMHERTFSKDSFLTLKEIVEIAKEKGLDGVCITDHDDIGIKEYAEQYSRETGFPIFVGYEFYSLQGDILAFGAPKVPSERISAQEFVDYVKSFGGVCIAAHPFRNNNRGLEENLATVKGLDGIERKHPSGCLQQGIFLRKAAGNPVHRSQRLSRAVQSRRLRHLASGNRLYSGRLYLRVQEGPVPPRRVQERRICGGRAGAVRKIGKTENFQPSD